MRNVISEALLLKKTIRLYLFLNSTITFATELLPRGAYNNNGLRLYPLNLMPVMRPKGGKTRKRERLNKAVHSPVHSRFKPKTT